MLRKREALRAAFAGFVPEVVAAYDDIEDLATDAQLIRSRPKLRACVRNAQATIALRDHGGLEALVRSHAQLPSPAYDAWAEVPAATPGSALLARELRAAGFTFVGPTTAYSLLQACGLVNDHLRTCPARAAAETARRTALC